METSTQVSDPLQLQLNLESVDVAACSSTMTLRLKKSAGLNLIFIEFSVERMEVGKEIFFQL